MLKYSHKLLGVHLNANVEDVCAKLSLIMFMILLFIIRRVYLKIPVELRKPLIA